MTRTIIERFLPDTEATDALGRALAATQPPQAVVYLHGDLGAGKSTLARAWLRALGVEGPIRSPTYTLVERYPIPGGEALHLDLYRIGGAGELEFLGLDEAGAALWLVEWPERGAGALPAWAAQRQPRGNTPPPCRYPLRAVPARRGCAVPTPSVCAPVKFPTPAALRLRRRRAGGHARGGGLPGWVAPLAR